MAKRRESGFELLASMPWPVPAVRGIIGFAFLRYGLAWALGTRQNVYLVGLGKELSGSP